MRCDETSPEDRVAATSLHPTNGIVSLDHTAIAVRDANASLSYYSDHLGLSVIGDEVAEEPGVRLIYLDAGNSNIQLVQPIAPGPVEEFLERHGEGLHHVCFAVASITGFLSTLPGQAGNVVFRGGRERAACFLQGTPEGVRIELTEIEPESELGRGADTQDDTCMPWQRSWARVDGP